jgi:hypothetical protein
MKTSELKTDLLNRITQLQDPRIIVEIHNFLDIEMPQDQPDSVSNTSYDDRVFQAGEDCKNAVYLTEDKANQDIEEWLNEK